MNNAFGIFIGAGIATTLSIILALFFFVPKVQSGFLPYPKIRGIKIQELLTYSMGNYLGRLLIQLPPLIIPLIIVNKLGPESNAVFYVVWAVVSILQVIPSAIFNSLFAEASNEASSLHKNTFNSLKFMMYLAVPSIIVIVLIAGKLLLIFGRTYSNEGTFLLQITALSIIPWGFNYLYISIARFEKQVGGVIKLAGLSTILSLILSYIFITYFGLIGAGIGYLAGQGISAIVVIILLRNIIFRNNEISV